jgi:hypothetical protein
MQDTENFVLSLPKRVPGTKETCRGSYDLPVGCDPLVSSLTRSQLARVAARCAS